MAGWRQTLRRVAADVRDGRHREAYAISALGLLLSALGVLGIASAQLLLSAVLLTVTFLVFHTTAQARGQPATLDAVLRRREGQGSFSQLLTNTTKLWIYGPTAVSALVHAPDIRQQVLTKGGQVRVIVQDPDSSARRDVRAQLDDNLDFDQALASSLTTLARMRTWGNCEYRLLAFSPGFSLVVVNVDRPDGFLILELHGFKDESLSSRMQVEISRSESLHWFDYWAGRFEAMWHNAREPDKSTPDGSSG